jgi:hypothetical protein
LRWFYFRRERLLAGWPSVAQRLMFRALWILIIAVTALGRDGLRAAASVARAAH